METLNNEKIAYATNGKGTNVLESVKLNRNKMENKMEMLNQVNELMSTLTFVQSALLEDDNHKAEIYIDYACKELSLIKYDYKKSIAELEQSNTK